MIEIRLIDEAHREDLNLPNEPFTLYGRMAPSYVDGVWSHTVEKLPRITEMCFPDEEYDYEETAKDSTFIGAYDEERCVGLAVLRKGFFAYMYLEDLKVAAAWRRKGVAGRLVDRACEEAAAAGCRGIYLEAQDNNLGACLFYLKAGFYIGGLDTNVYKGTRQEGKSNIIFYRDCKTGT